MAVNKEVLQNIPEGATRAQIEAQMPAWAGATVHVAELGTQAWKLVAEEFGAAPQAAQVPAAPAFATPAPAQAAAVSFAPLTPEELVEFNALNERLRSDAGSATDADIARLGVLQERGMACRQITVQ